MKQPDTPAPLPALDATAAAARIRAGDLTASALTEACLERVAQTDGAIEGGFAGPARVVCSTSRGKRSMTSTELAVGRFRAADQSIGPARQSARRSAATLTLARR